MLEILVFIALVSSEGSDETVLTHSLIRALPCSHTLSGEVDKTDKLEKDLKEVNKLWSDVSVAMEERIRYIEEIIEHLEEHEVLLINS